MTNNKPESDRIEVTKRNFVRSVAGSGISLASIAQTGLATQDSYTKFVKFVKESKQYEKISQPVITAGFQPQFNKATVFDLTPNETVTGISGTGLELPTQSSGVYNADVTLTALHSPEAGRFEIQARVEQDGVFLGSLYTNKNIVESIPGYHTTHETNGFGRRGPIFSQQGFGGGLIPDNPIPDDPIPDDPIGSIIDAGEEIVDGAEDVWNETAEFVSNNDKIQKAVDVSGSAADITYDIFSPVDTDKPPQGLLNSANNEGYYHLMTIDLTKTCWYISAGALAGATGLTVGSAGAGAVSYSIPATIGTVCLVVSAFDSFAEDAGICSPTELYVFMPDVKRTNGHPWAFPGCER